MFLADSFWGGAGGPIVAAVAGGVAGWGSEWLRTRQKEKRELRASARAIAQAFANAESALRVAANSGGSLVGWGSDDGGLSDDLDLIRKRADRDLWSRVESALSAMRDLRAQQQQSKTVLEEDCKNWARSFGCVAGELRAAAEGTGRRRYSRRARA